MNFMSGNNINYIETRKYKYWNHPIDSAFNLGFKPGVIVKGNTIKCTINGKVVVVDDMRVKNTDGMIGMSIWSQDGISSAVISNFTSSLVQE